jgi:acyl-CoA synthetase (AMP-forming)/AMP-acid ligase II
MIFRSPLPEVSLPEQPLVEYLFADHHQYPDHVALIDCKANVQVTYQQLYDKAVTVAFNLIHKFNVKKGDVIAVYLHNRFVHEGRAKAAMRDNNILGGSFR